MYLTHDDLGYLYTLEREKWAEFVLPFILEEELEYEPAKLIDTWLDSVIIENGEFVFQIVCIVLNGDNFIYSASFKQLLDANIIA